MHCFTVAYWITKYFLCTFKLLKFLNFAIVILLPIKFQLLQKQYLSLFLTLRSVSDKLTFTLRFRLQDLHIAVVGRTIEKRSHESMYKPMQKKSTERHLLLSRLERATTTLEAIEKNPQFDSALKIIFQSNK